MTRMPNIASRPVIAWAMIASLGLAAYAAPAAAQDAPAPADTSATTADANEGAIVVTARRREERLVDVPIAVTAISGAELAKRGALDITDISESVPNVTLENSRATNSTLSAFIRGIGQQDPVSGFEQGVGIYLDDVYLNRPQAAVLDIYDVERIEVLRGPQGTLYGRNTIGGAVKYVTKRLPQDLDIHARATYGTYNQAEGVLTASAPVNDLIRVGGSIARLSRGGFGDNLTTGRENYNKDLWAGRASLEMGGYGEPVFIRISGDYTKDNSDPRNGHRLIPGLKSGTPVLSNVFDTQGGIDDPKQSIEAYGLAMNVQIDLAAGLTARSISAWRRDHSATPIDFDALPAVDLDVPGIYRNEQISQELQLLYDRGPVNALLGFYYLDAQADTLFESRLYTSYPTALPKLTGYTAALVHTTTSAIFGDVTIDLTDKLSVAAGGRYTWDRRDADITKQSFILGGSGAFGPRGTLIGTDTDFNGSANFRKFTPRASISFKPTPDHNIYASYSQGFKGGGFDPRGAGANAPDLDHNGVLSNAEVADYLSFDPEQVDSYELGYKGSFAGGKVYVALAGFYADYSNVQIPGSQACTIKGVPTFCGVVTNAGKATFKGLEFEGSARLGGGLSVSASLGYIDAKFDKYITQVAGLGPVDVAQYRHVQNTPKFTGSASANYTMALGEGDLAFTTSVSYRSKTYQFEIANPYLDQGGYALVDGSILYTAPGGRWTLGLFGKNLFDKIYKTSGYTYMAADPKTGELLHVTGAPLAIASCPGQTFPVGSLYPALGCEGTLTAFYGNPRQVFVTGTVKF